MQNAELPAEVQTVVKEFAELAVQEATTLLSRLPSSPPLSPLGLGERTGGRPWHGPRETRRMCGA